MLCIWRRRALYVYFCSTKSVKSVDKRGFYLFYTGESCLCFAVVAVCVVVVVVVAGCCWLLLVVVVAVVVFVGFMLLCVARGLRLCALADLIFAAQQHKQ